MPLPEGLEPLGTGTVIYDSEHEFAEYVLGEERRLVRFDAEAGKQSDTCWLLLTPDGERISFNLLDVLVCTDDIGQGRRFRLSKI